LASVNCPDVTDPVQEFEPVYVPDNADAVAVAVPVRSAVQAAHGSSKPPAGIVIANATFVPDIVPDTEPRPDAPELVSIIVTVPENAEPDWVSCHTVVPGPDESDAAPLHEPERLIGSEGWLP